MFNSAVAVVTFALLARVLDKNEFGFWTFFLTVVGLFEMGLFGLVKTPLIRMISNEDKTDQTKIVSAAWQISFRTTSLIILFSSLCFALIYLILKEQIYLHYIYWIVLYMLFSLPRQVAIWLSNARVRFDRILWIRLISTVVFLGFTAGMFFTDANIFLVFWAYFLSVAASSLFSAFIGWAEIRQLWLSAGQWRKEMFDFGRFSMGTSLGTASLGSSDSILIMFFLGPEYLALYQVPKRINALYEIPLRAILQFAYPSLTKKSKYAGEAAFTNTVERMMGFTAIILFPVAILIFLFARPIIMVLGGIEYVESIPVLQVSAIFLAMSSIDRFSGLILDSIGRPKYNFLKTLVMLSVNVIADIVVINLGYGVVGVAAVTTITSLAGSFYGFNKFKDLVPFRPKFILKAGLIQLKSYFHQVAFRN